MIKLSASIVIYNTNPDTLFKAINSFYSIEIEEKELIILDNSENYYDNSLFLGFDNLQYIHSEVNLGFGRGHNLAFKNLSIESDIHLIINPDVSFIGEEIKDMLLWFQKDREISLAIPAIYYPNGELQHVGRNIPTLESILKRRLNLFGIFNNYVKKDELDQVLPNSISEIPFAHGCFIVIKSEVYKKIDGFDECFFMYFEDVDLFMKAKKYGKTVINPDFKILHEYEKGSSKSLKLLFEHIISAIKFFKKYNF